MVKGPAESSQKQLVKNPSYHSKITTTKWAPQIAKTALMELIMTMEMHKMIMPKIGSNSIGTNTVK